jgi:F-type H+-transporting ATPase subunit a
LKNLLTFFLVLAVAALICGLPTLLLPTSGIPVAFPHIQLPAEAITGSVRILGIEFFLSNTLLSVLLADVILIIMAVVAGNAARKRLKAYETNPAAVDADGDDMMVPKGWHNTFEAILEYLYNLVETIVGSRWVRSVFPISATIFLLVLVANYLHFVPLVDSFGVMHCADPAKNVKGFEPVEIGSTGIYRLGFAEDNVVFPAGEPAAACPAHGEEGAAEAGSSAEHSEEEFDAAGLRVTVTPFLRTAATDLNLTFALALVAIVTVQVLGVRELGFGYFSKFFNLPALSKGFMGWIDLIVSWLEIIAEIFKTVSLSFRLFGNITAGAILLAVMAFLIPVGAPVIFYMLELLIGAIQALVFFMLTTVFVAVAQAGHGDHGHADEHH